MVGPLQNNYSAWYSVDGREKNFIISFYAKNDPEAKRKAGEVPLLLKRLGRKNELSELELKSMKLVDLWSNAPRQIAI